MAARRQAKRPLETSRRIQLILPRDLIGKVDSVAEESFYGNRSMCVEQALRDLLRGHQAPEAA